MDNFFTKVKNLNLPVGNYAIFGSGPLCVRGLRECRDLDIVVTENVFEEYKKRPGWELKKTETNSYLENNGIEFWRDWGLDYFPGQWDVKKLISEAEIIDGLPFVKLEEVVKWKKMLKREKDLKDIELIENYLKKRDKN